MPLALLLLAAVPDVVLTTDQAARLSPRRLEQLLLAGFPHGPIDRVDQPSTVRTKRPAAVPFDEQPLNSIIFHERPRAAGGTFCSARRIVASFTTLDRGVADAPGFPPAATPRRLVDITAAPLLGIVDNSATDPACAQAGAHAQLPMSDPARGRRAVERWLAIRRQSGDGSTPVPLTCVNARVWPEQPCNGAAELAAIPPAALITVDLPSAVRGPTIQLQFAGREFWTVDLHGVDRVTAVSIRRALPPPP